MNELIFGVDVNNRLPKDFVHLPRIPNFKERKSIKSKENKFEKEPLTARSLRHPNASLDFSFKITKKSNYWSEIKFETGKITERAYHAICFYENYLYMYGGYNDDHGVFSDFYRYSLVNDDYITNGWKKVDSINDGPGPLCSHSLSLIKGKLYIIGGKKSTFENSNKIFTFDLVNKNWENLSDNKKGNLEKFPALDSFSENLYLDEKIIIFGGFLSKEGKYSNNIIEIDISKNVIKKIEQSLIAPVARANHKSVLFEKSLYIFGGHDENNKMNDLWKFDLIKHSWIEIRKDLNEFPIPRSNHSLLLYQDKLILFGGAYNHTLEKNDIFVFSIPDSKWKCLEQDSVAKLDVNNTNMKSSLSSSKKKTNMKIANNVNFLTKITRNSLSYSPKKNKDSPKLPRINTTKQIKSNFANLDSESTRNLINSARNLTKAPSQLDVSPPFLRKSKKSMSLIKAMDMKRSTRLSPSTKSFNNSINIADVERRIFEAKKKNLLNQFEINDDKLKFQFLAQTTATTEKLKQIIDLVSKNKTKNIFNQSPTKPQRGYQKNIKSDSNSFNHSVTPKKPSEKNQIRYNYNSYSKKKMEIQKFAEVSRFNKKILGNRPCAREGQASVLFQNKMVIFGGSRLKIFLNDFYECDLEKLLTNNTNNSNNSISYK